MRPLAVLALLVAPLAQAQFAKSPEVLTTPGASYTAGSGSNRLVIFTIGRETEGTGTTPSVTAMSWGTASIANGEIVEVVTANRTVINRPRASIYCVLEADIPSGAQSVSVTWNVAMAGSDEPIAAYTLVNRDQDCAGESTGARTTGTPNAWSGSLPVTAGSVQILTAVVEANNSSTPATGWTEHLDQGYASTAYRRVAQYRTDGVGTVTWALNFFSDNAGVAVVASFAEAAAVDDPCDALTDYAQCVRITSIDPNSWVHQYNASSSTDIAIGDYVGLPAVTDQGAPWKQWGDGNGCYPWDEGGEICAGGTDVRHMIVGEVYDVSASALMAAPIRLVLNDPPIICSPVTPFDYVQLAWKIDEAKELIDFAQICTHPDDELVFSSDPPLPDGVGLSSEGLLTSDGTEEEDEAGTEHVVYASNAYGGSGGLSAYLYPLDTVTAPDCSGLDVAECAGLADVRWLNAEAIFSCRTGVDIGVVLSQSPVAEYEAEPFSAFSILASNGPCTRQFPPIQFPRQ